MKFPLKTPEGVPMTTVEDGSGPKKTTELRLQLSGCKSNSCKPGYGKLVK